MSIIAVVVFVIAISVILVIKKKKKAKNGEINKIGQQSSIITQNWQKEGAQPIPDTEHSIQISKNMLTTEINET